MNLDLRAIAGTAALILMAAGSAWWLRSLEPPVTLEGAAHRPDSMMNHFRITNMDLSGEPKNRLWGEEMVHFPDDDSTELTQPRMEVYRSQGKPWRVASERGWIASGNELVLLQGEVRIRRDASASEPPLAVDTRDMRVLPDDEYAETEAPAVIANDEMRTTGIGMRAYLGEDRLQLLDKVRSHYEKKKP